MQALWHVDVALVKVLLAWHVTEIVVPRGTGACKGLQGMVQTPLTGVPTHVVLVVWELTGAGEGGLVQAATVPHEPYWPHAPFKHVAVTLVTVPEILHVPGHRPPLPTLLAQFAQTTFARGAGSVLQALWHLETGVDQLPGLLWHTVVTGMPVGTGAWSVLQAIVQDWPTAVLIQA